MEDDPPVALEARPERLVRLVPLAQTTLPSDVNVPDGGSNCSSTVNVTAVGGAVSAGTTPTAAAS
jgi:hypothetical protein